MLKVCACEEVGAHHFQAVTPGLIGSEHQAGSLKGFFNYGQLALIKLEVNNLPKLGVFSRKMPFHLSLKTLLR